MVQAQVRKVLRARPEQGELQRQVAEEVAVGTKGVAAGTNRLRLTFALAEDRLL